MLLSCGGAQFPLDSRPIQPMPQSHGAPGIHGKSVIRRHHPHAGMPPCQIEQRELQLRGVLVSKTRLRV